MSESAPKVAPALTREEGATLSPKATAGNNAASRSPAAGPKARSCTVCRSRKVRCDKQSPCTNCRRAGIECIVPDAKDRPPRWARRLARVSKSAAGAAIEASPAQMADPNVTKVMSRLRNLEDLVKELTGQLEKARSESGSIADGASNVNSPGQSQNVLQRSSSSAFESTNGVDQHLGRMVLQDASHSRYISSGFWSRVEHELDGLKSDTQYLAVDDSDSSEDESSSGRTPASTHETSRTPFERNAFLFRQTARDGTPASADYHPLPSQVPFLLDVFSENVNQIFQTVHMPTITKLVRQSRSNNQTVLTPHNEALLLSIYYAAITSMEEEDVMTNFGAPKSDLALKFRLGFELALAQADFLDKPDLILVQALALFLLLARRHDSPRWVWMMTGLLIRMAHYLGLHRDGSNLEHVSPYETEIRRRVWWVICMLDMRASEDQGTEMMIVRSKTDTKFPSNINDEDIDPTFTKPPATREGIADATLARISAAGITDVAMRMVERAAANDGTASLVDQSRLLNEIAQRVEEEYFRHVTNHESKVVFMGLGAARLVMAKLTLINFLPVLFGSGETHISGEIRDRLLVSAIEVAEYNHTLNEKVPQWRWVYQTHTHWHAIIYLLIEISRRALTPMVERAWTALHSVWLIPPEVFTQQQDARIWLPLKKLMRRAGKHRNAEIDRLRQDRELATRLDVEDSQMLVPSSSAIIEGGDGMEEFRKKWRALVMCGPRDNDTTWASQGPTANPEIYGAGVYQQFPGSANSAHVPIPTYSVPDTNPRYLQPTVNSTNAAYSMSSSISTPTSELNQYTSTPPLHQRILTSNDGFSPPAAPWLPSQNSLGPGLMPWLWPDTDMATENFPVTSDFGMDTDMDFGSDSGTLDVNWYNWVQSAQGVEFG